LFSILNTPTELHNDIDIRENVMHFYTAVAE